MLTAYLPTFQFFSNPLLNLISAASKYNPHHFKLTKSHVKSKYLVYLFVEALREPKKAMV